MTEKQLFIGSTVSLTKTELDGLLADLRSNGYCTVGPRPQDEGIVYKEIETLADLPHGIRTEQSPAHYHMTQTGLDRYFDFIPGGQSWKQFLFPPRTTVLSAHKADAEEKIPGKWIIDEDQAAQPRYAFIGVRACEMAAIDVQDKVFLLSDFHDPVYRSRREGLFILAVNCLDPDETCFCASMNTGPRHKAGFDLSLTELDDTFLVEVGSELGGSLLARRNFELPSAYLQNAAAQELEHAAMAMGRLLDMSDLPDLLMNNLEADHWDDVSKRCLSCANCTQVCPTCFCWNATETMDLTGKKTQRERVWDSCFNPNFSYVFGGNTRPSIRSRYRQWLTHKLGSWKDQFGVFGCVGCGRCITWCPAGIDLTAEIVALRAEVKK